jgi:hypothetical protein
MKKWEVKFDILYTEFAEVATFLTRWLAMAFRERSRNRHWKDTARLFGAELGIIGGTTKTINKILIVGGQDGADPGGPSSVKEIW